MRGIDIINDCRELFDSITITKGYLQLNACNNNGEYCSPEILQHISEMEKKLCKIVDSIEQGDKYSKNFTC